MGKPIPFEAFVAEFSIEAFDIFILGGFSGLVKVLFDILLISPEVHLEAAELGSIVGEDALRAFVEFDALVQNAGYAQAGERGVDLNPEALLGVLATIVWGRSF